MYRQSALRSRKLLSRFSLHPCFNLLDNSFPFLEIAMSYKPTWAFRHVLAKEQDERAQKGADPESAPPSEIDQQDVRVQQDDRCAGIKVLKEASLVRVTCLSAADWL